MTTTDMFRLLRAFVDELARCGMRDACTSPGSRSTPILLSLAREERLRCWSHLDERCAGFFALGAAKASGRPVAVACTSGTAALHFAPAVYEAREARVPLIVLTADRPPELRDVGAGQTVDQIKLYGDAAKWFVEVGTHEATPERLRWIRTLACRAYWTSLWGRPGPVHLNFPLREPLVLEDPLEAEDGGREDRRPWVSRPGVLSTPEPGALDELAAEIRAHPRGVLVAGRSERAPGLAAAVAELASAVGYPVLADPLSGARHGPAAIAHYDALLREEGFVAHHRPEVVLRVGDLPTSKPLRNWLSGSEHAMQVRIDAEEAWQDPDGTTARLLAADPAATLRELASRLAGPAAGTAEDGWLDGWRDADRRAAGAIASTLGDELSEPRVAAELGTRLPGEATVFVASSMPVRDVETFWPARDDPPRVLSNRGANGIDGTVSAAFGAAAASDRPVVLVIGDVALAHDIGGLLAASRLGLKLTIVLLHNDGGGIFHFLPVVKEGADFEEHVATPHGLDFAHAAALYGCAHERASHLAAFRGALDRALSAERTAIVEVRTDREENVAVHRRVWEAVSGGIAGTHAPTA